MNLPRISPDQLQAFVRTKPVFQRAEQLTGVPWQAIAAIWYRESFSVTSPKTPGGPFQFDPLPSPQALGTWLEAYAPSLTPAERADLVKQGVEKFSSGAIFCACWLRRQSHYPLMVDHSDKAIADAMYGYNGRAFGPNPFSSNYVANEMDLSHHGMLIRGTIPDGHGGRIKIRNTDKRPGAFTVYKQLLEAKI